MVVAALSLVAALTSLVQPVPVSGSATEAYQAGLRVARLEAVVGPVATATTQIERFYDVDRGAVRVDGHDVRDASPLYRELATHQLLVS